MDKMIRNVKMIISLVGLSFSMGYARSILISTSKIRNRRATRKNWKEKGMWEGVIRLNPHSNFVHLFIDLKLFFFTIRHSNEKMTKRSREETIIVVSFIIIYVCCF